MKVRRLTLTYPLLTSLTAVLCIQLKNKKNNKTKICTFYMFRQISIKHLHNYSWRNNIIYSLTIHSGAFRECRQQQHPRVGCGGGSVCQAHALS